MFWPFTAWIDCSSDLKNFANSQPSASKFKSFSRSLEQFFLTVGQKNFGNKIPLTLNFDATLVKYWICLFFHHNFFVGKLISNSKNHIICFTNQESKIWWKLPWIFSKNLHLMNFSLFNILKSIQYYFKTIITKTNVYIMSKKGDFEIPSHKSWF